MVYYLSQLVCMSEFRSNLDGSFEVYHELVGTFWSQMQSSEGLIGMQGLLPRWLTDRVGHLVLAVGCGLQFLCRKPVHRAW